VWGVVNSERYPSNHIPSSASVRISFKKVELEDGGGSTKGSKKDWKCEGLYSDTVKRNRHVENVQHSGCSDGE